MGEHRQVAMGASRHGSMVPVLFLYFTHNVSTEKSANKSAPNEVVYFAAADFPVNTSRIAAEIVPP